MTTHWTLGVLIGLPIGLGIVLILAVVGIVGLVRGETDAFGWDEWKMAGFWSAICAGIAAVVVALSLFPYHAQYHQWRPVSGVVTQVGVRQISDGSSMSQRYVLEIDGQPYGVDDTRAALVKPGDSVNLACKSEWQWASTPGKACRWVSQ